MVPRPPELEHFDGCVGLLNLNHDTSVCRKLQQKGQKALCRRDRAQLVRLAVADLPWLRFSESPTQWCHGAALLAQRFPRLDFVDFTMNGADDVVKYRKWRGAGPNCRLITMGRPGSSEHLRRGAASAQVRPEHFLMGPELPDISSTAVRDVCARGDADALLSMVHPDVADWLLRSEGHEGLLQPLTGAAGDEVKLRRAAVPRRSEAVARARSSSPPGARAQAPESEVGSQDGGALTVSSGGSGREAAPPTGLTDESRTSTVDYDPDGEVASSDEPVPDADEQVPEPSAPSGSSPWVRRESSQDRAVPEIRDAVLDEFYESRDRQPDAESEPSAPLVPEPDA